MKAIVDIQTFKEHTALAGRAISPKISNPILSNLKLVADCEAWAAPNRTGKISLTGTDAINTITTSFEAEVIETGTVLLNASKLNSLLERLGNGELTLTKIEGETEVIIHTQEYGTFELPTTTEEYPADCDRPSFECFTVHSEHLTYLVKKTLYAASGDEYKQVLTGVRFSLGEVLKLVATDGHKLALSMSPIKISDTRQELTVSAETLKQLSWALAKLPPGKIIVGIDEGSYISFTLGEFCLTGRLIAGNYPNYHQLFPSNFIRSLHVDRSSLLSALTRVSLFHNNDRLIGIELLPEQKQLILSASSSDLL